MAAATAAATLAQARGGGGGGGNRSGDDTAQARGSGGGGGNRGGSRAGGGGGPFQGNAGPGLVHLSARCSSVAIRGHSSEWPREEGGGRRIRQSGSGSGFIRNPKSQEELSETYVTTSRRQLPDHLGAVLLCLAVLISLSLLSFRFLAQVANEKTFSAPGDAALALYKAAKSDDSGSLAIFGSNADGVLHTGDDVTDKNLIAKVRLSL